MSLRKSRGSYALVALLLVCSSAFAADAGVGQACPRPSEGATVQQPPELRSQNGVLEVSLHFRYQATVAGQGPPRYCYVTDDGLESPTLRLHPGDQLIIHFHNDLPPQPSMAHDAARSGPDADCKMAAMNASLTNLHFHGLTVPPTCHQDDVIRTAIPAGDAFDYRITIPRDEPPGLYWYHPHPHGFSERQVQGGASGALIVEGLRQVDPSLARIPERVLVLRDQALTNLRLGDMTPPAWDISVNFVPVIYPQYQAATLEAQPQQKELWRVLNAGADNIFNLQIRVGGMAQPVKVVAIDGVPTASDSPSRSETSVLLPPGARAEFVMETPKAGERAQLVTTEWDTGPQGDRDPARPIANIVTDGEHTAEDEAEPPSEPDAAKRSSWRPPGERPAIVQRRLYFSQYSPNPVEGDASVFYFVTVAGDVPAMYRMGQPPNIIVHQGDVEDWIVENRSQEDHVFHIHQIHFRVLEVNGKPVNDGTLRDTFDLPYWDGAGPYPSVKLRMDFRDPNSVGTFLYHCHILKHEDMGMMGVIEVLPPGVPTTITLKTPAKIETATSIEIVASVTGKSTSSASPTGLLQFMVDGITAGKPVPVVQGKATLVTSFDATGAHVITAIYAGDKIYDESASRPLKIRVVD